jgi:hypothetical protein
MPLLNQDATPAKPDPKKSRMKPRPSPCLALGKTAALSPPSLERPSLQKPGLLLDRSERALDLVHDVTLDHVAGTHVLIILESHATFLADGNFLHLVLEAFQR